MFSLRWPKRKQAVAEDPMSPKRMAELMTTKIKEDPYEEKEEEEEEEDPIFTNSKNRFVEQFLETSELVKQAEKRAADIAAGTYRKHVAKAATAGRIQFEGIFIEEVTVPLLLCDNCEVRYSVVWCGACKEVTCLRCCELCHPIEQGEKLHLHEQETVHRPPSIRAIVEGDRSKVVVPPDFPIPDYYIEENDAEKAKGVDLTQPNSLATNYTDPSAYLLPNTTPYTTLPKYAVDDKLIFTDPVSGQQAYGRVISEWDQRHGVVAPSILRGEGSLYLYFVEKIDLVANIGTLADLLKLLAEKEEIPEYPVFKDTEDVPYRWEFAAAREVNRKVNEMHVLQKHGPRRHFRGPEVLKKPPTKEEEADVNSITNSLEKSLVTFEGEDDNGSVSVLSQLAKAEFLDQPPEEVVAKEDSNDLKVSFRAMDLTKEEQLDRLREEQPEVVLALTSPRDSSKRSFFHSTQIDNPAAKEEIVKTSPTKKAGGGGEAAYMGKSKVKKNKDEPLKIIDQTRVCNVLVLKEKDLFRPEEVFNMEDMQNQNNKLSKKEIYLTRTLNGLKRQYKTMAFKLWKYQLEDLLIRLKNHMSMRIQKYARKWLQRGTLDRLSDEWQAICYQRWQLLHSQFHYCARETPYSVTMNHKLYFLTKLDANKYAEYLRMTCKRVLKFTGRKRNKMMMICFQLWKRNSTELNESDIKFGHFDMTAMDMDDGYADDTGEKGDYGSGPTGKTTRLRFPIENIEEESLSALQQAEAQELYTNFRKLGVNRSGVSGNDEAYVNVSTIPLAITRKPAIPPPELTAEEKKEKLAKKNRRGYFETEEDEEDAPFDHDGVLPPYRPDLSIKLPAAIPIYMPSNAEERLHVSQSRRLTYCSYKAHMQGPCDDASWIIPGRIAMGAIPWGRANKRTQTSSITSLLLGGCDVFVSCMSEEEENECEKRLGIPPIGKTLKKAAAGARMAVDEVVRNSKRICDEMQKKLKNIPVLSHEHPDYAVMKKELTRCKARVKLSTEARSRAQGEFERLPKVFDWIRITIKSNECPTLQEILPVLWQLERKLSEGRSLYIYSREGHGRCGLLAGCLLGRLYSFNASETLIRLQNSHDCAKREESRPVPINCPQLNAHRNLITQVVNHSNRPMMGIVMRHHDDPETKHDILNMPKRGTGLGLNYHDTPKNLQVTQSAPFATVTQSEQNVDIMVRKKETVSFEIKLERDVKVSYETQHGRGDDKPNIPEIYEMHTNPKKLGQNINIVRETELQRQKVIEVDRNKRQVEMPVLRVKNTAP